MISPTVIKLKLGQERARLKRHEQTDFVKGVIYGLQFASTCIDEITKDSSILRSQYIATINRWSAAAFYQAITTSLTSFRNGDYRRGKERLEKAVEQTRTSHKIATATTVKTPLPGSPRR